MLAEETIWSVQNQPNQVHFVNNIQGRFTSTLRKLPEAEEANTSVHHFTTRSGATNIPVEIRHLAMYGFQAVAREFYKLHKPKNQ